MEATEALSSGYLAAFPVRLSEVARNTVAPKKKNHLCKQRDASCPDLATKIFRFPAPPNHRHIYRRLATSRGAARDRHGRWERDAVDANGALDEAH